MTFGKFNVDYEQRIYNPERMRKYRLDRAHAALKKYGLGAMIVYDYDNWRYLGYHTWHNYNRRRPGRYLLLIRDEGYPYLWKHDENRGEYQLEPWLRDKMVLNMGVSVQMGLSLDDAWSEEQYRKQAEEIKRYLNKHKVADLPVGIDCHFGLRTVTSLQKAGINLVDGNPAMAEARMIKNEDEIECLRTAGSIVESAFWEVAKALKPGLTEWQMCGVAAKACYDQGAEELEGPSFMARSGPQYGHYQTGTGTDRVIRPGELFVMDINGVSFQGYRTCFYRTFCVGDKPTEAQKEIYQAALDSQLAMENAIKPGLTNRQVTEALMKKGKGRWYDGPTYPKPGIYYQGGLGGHELGLASGDCGPGFGGPLDRPEANLRLEKGRVFAVEVGCMRCEEGGKWTYDGAKVENVGYVTDTGFEVFYRFPYKDLITVGLPGEY
ncbi:MAG: Xaa-Pro peptidase family protein [Candidatus Bathyarchaeota archaeon]